MASQAGDDPAEGVLEFVNTRPYEPLGLCEQFGTADDFSAWARERGLLGDEPVSESGAAAARELRAALVTVMKAHSEHAGLSESELEEAEHSLAHAGELYPVKVTLAAHDSEVTGHGRGVAGALGAVLAAGQLAVGRGTWNRLKVCTCEPCEKGFIDHTKSGRQRYCSSTCSSRAAMRSLRQRQQQGRQRMTTATGR